MIEYYSKSTRNQVLSILRSAGGDIKHFEAFIIVVQIADRISLGLIH